MFGFGLAFQRNRRFMLPFLILIIVTLFSLILLVIFLYTTPHYDYNKTSRMKQALRDSGLLVHNDLFVNKIIYSFATGLYTLQTMGSDGGCRRKVATGRKSE